MTRVEGRIGVPTYMKTEFSPKSSAFCVLIPIINEGERIHAELGRAKQAGICEKADIILCDGGSNDGSMDLELLRKMGVNTLLVKQDVGKQGAQLRMGISFALERGYEGVITVDGNNKDSVESIPLFIEKLLAGYDLVQGSRFISGGRAVNTPWQRWLAVRLIHAPVISLTARFHFTDTTNAFRAYSRKYLTHPDVQPLRDIFSGYELLAYLSVRATQLGLRACEVPVARVYPKGEKTPTKIKGMRGNIDLLKILFNNFRGMYVPGNGGETVNEMR